MPAFSDTAIAHSDDALRSAASLPQAPDSPVREVDAYERRLNFCAHLKSARERRGIPLQAISDATKVSESLFAELERCDVSRWPLGIYRRAFIREYAAFIGLPVESTVGEFQRLFPEEIDRESGKATLLPGPLRLTLASGLWARISPLQAQAAALDVVLILSVSGLLVWLTPMGFPGALAAIALTYHVAATVLIGRSPGTWLIRRDAARRRWRLSRLISYLWTQRS